MCVALDPARYGGAVWAVPLWSERGLIGVLLLGDKHDGGLYTQEEIEIARATGERLIDTQASAEMARRLMDLQRQRLAESQVIDRRTRRVLHDDVLPKLHAAMLMLSAVEPTTDDPFDTAVPELVEGQGRRRPTADDEGHTTRYAGDGASHATRDMQHEQVVALLADVHRQVANLLHAMPATAAPEVARLGLIGALRQAVEGELASAFDGVTWRIEPGAEDTAGAVPTLNAEVAFYAAREAIRNAARYGRNGEPSRPLHLAVFVARRHQDGAKGGGLEIAIQDDGVGMGAAGASAEGSGQGLGLHGTMMAVIGGALTAESVPGVYTRVTLALPDA
jgi:signal transduction histidine kinase